MNITPGSQALTQIVQVEDFWDEHIRFRSDLLDHLAEPGQVLALERRKAQARRFPIGAHRFGQGAKEVIPVNRENEARLHHRQQCFVVSRVCTRRDPQDVGWKGWLATDATLIQPALPANLDQEADTGIHAVVSYPQRWPEPGGERTRRKTRDFQVLRWQD